MSKSKQSLTHRDLTKAERYSRLLSRLSPQATKVLGHLVKYGTISNVEANAVYCVRSVSSRISEITKALDAERIDFIVQKNGKRDATGQRYVRYTLEALS